MDHYGAKKSGKKVRQNRKWVEVSKSEVKAIKKFLYS